MCWGVGLRTQRSIQMPQANGNVNPILPTAPAEIAKKRKRNNGQAVPIHVNNANTQPPTMYQTPTIIQPEQDQQQPNTLQAYGRGNTQQQSDLVVMFMRELNKLKDECRRLNDKVSRMELEKQAMQQKINKALARPQPQQPNMINPAQPHHDGPMVVFELESKTPRVLKSNVQFNKLFGYTERQVKGMEWVHFIHPDNVERTMKVLRDQSLTKKTNQQVYTIELPQIYVTASGEQLHAVDYHTFFMGAHGPILDIVHIVPLATHIARLNGSNTKYPRIEHNTNSVVSAPENAPYGEISPLPLPLRSSMDLELPTDDLVQPILSSHVPEANIVDNLNNLNLRAPVPIQQQQPNFDVNNTQNRLINTEVGPIADNGDIDMLGDHGLAGSWDLGYMDNTAFDFKYENV